MDSYEVLDKLGVIRDMLCSYSHTLMQVDECIHALDIAEETYNAEASCTGSDGWIYVEDAMPKKDVVVDIAYTTKSGEVCVGISSWGIKTFGGRATDEWWWKPLYCVFNRDRVIAWRYRPDPPTINKAPPEIESKEQIAKYVTDKSCGSCAFLDRPCYVDPCASCDRMTFSCWEATDGKL